MIQLVSDDPVIIALFEDPPTGTLLKFRYLLKAGKRRFVSPYMVLRQTEDKELLEAINCHQQPKDYWHRLDQDTYSRLGYRFRLSDYLPSKEIDREFSQADQHELRKLQAAYGALQGAQIKLGDALLNRDERFARFCSLEDYDTPSNTLPRYVHRNGWIWSSLRKLSADEWMALIDHATRRDQAELARLTQSNEPFDSARLITVEVRREVWRRDNGKCSNCGSQERLEFDHIIPVSVGGSNTVRNIQLLCEQCNRQKGATLG
jgi:HNH endonuclease